MKHLTLFLASGVALVGACSNDDKTSSDVTQAEYDDVAQSVGNSAAPSGGGGDVGAMADVTVIAKGNLPLGFSIDASGGVSGSHGGLAYSYSLTCKDANGDTQATCNAMTDTANATLSWSGNLALPDFMTSIQRDGTWMLSGLQGTIAKFAGDGTFTDDTSITNAATSVTTAYHFDYNATYDAVLIDMASSDVIGGKIEYQIDANKDVDGASQQSFSVTADVTFNGDGTATIVLDGTHTYKETLSTGVVVSVSN